MNTIAVIGGGWYGCYISLRLSQAGYKVILYEKNSNLIGGTSKTYGIRLHAGPHYPRSAATRAECHQAFHRFQRELPGLSGDLERAIYCLGTRDCEDLPARVDVQTFQSVCKEAEYLGPVKEIDSKAYGFENVQCSFDVYEPCFNIDKKQAYFHKQLLHSGIEIKLNTKVTSLENRSDCAIVNGEVYDFAVNCTYYQDFVSETMPYGCKFFYQPCLALEYSRIDKDGQIQNPFSFTVMDGWFPCIMPLLNSNNEPDTQKYVLYHAKYSMLGSFDDVKQCQAVANRITDDWVLQYIRPKMEADISRFYTSFHDEFVYTGWRIAVGTKVTSLSEHRSVLVWADRSVIQVFSGKISSIFQAAEDVLAVLAGRSATHSVVVSRQELDADNDISKYKGSGTVQCEDLLTVI